jgi:prephenate dehydrogenase
MAETHALAYFVAKGMLDAGVKLDAENAPPSSQAILRTVDAVRSDAGHLFAALHLDNPYAEAVRERFLGALSRIDRALREAGPDDDETESAALSIPDLGERSPEIREVRDLIDDIDRSIVGLLARRALMARRAAKAKAGLGVGIRDPRREYNLLSERRAWAESSGLDPDAIEALFESILRWSRKLQADS